MIGEVEAGKDLHAEQRVLLQDLVSQWASQNSSRITGVHLRERSPGSFMLLVILAGLRYDDELSDRLIDFDLEIAEHPGLAGLKYQSLAVPNAGTASLEAFLPEALDS